MSVRHAFIGVGEKESVAAKVHDRVHSYGNHKLDWHRTLFLPVLEKLAISLIAWEQLLEAVERHDAASAESFRAFYARCLIADGAVSPRRNPVTGPQILLKGP